MQWDVRPDQRAEIGTLVPVALLDLMEREPVDHRDMPVQVPLALWSTLYQYQQDGVRQIVHRFKGRCLLADEMGLGKTLQAIAVLLHYDCDVLIICPSFLQTTWRRTLQEHTNRATVCSYGKLPVPSVDYGMVVVDEAHYLKSLDSQRTQAILPLLLLAQRVLLLSGTPCPNRPEELYPLLHAIRPNLVPSFSAFASRYCNPRRTAFCACDTRGSDRADELKWLLGRAYWVRRTKAAVLTELPSKRTGTLHVDADPAMRSTLDELHSRMQQALSRGSKLAQTLISEMYRVTAHAKMAAAVELVAARVSHGEPVVIFAHHQCMLDAMQASLPQDGSVGRIDGQTPLSKRQEVVDGLQCGALRVAVLSMGAAGVGLTLTRACTAYFLEIPWCPAVLRQCEDRIHRIGQTLPCNIYYVLAHDTLDMHVWRTIHRKERVGARIGQ